MYLKYWCRSKIPELSKICTALCVYVHPMNFIMSRVRLAVSNHLLLPNSLTKNSPPPLPHPFWSLNCWYEAYPRGRSELYVNCGTLTLPSLPHPVPQNPLMSGQYCAWCEIKRTLSRLLTVCIFHFSPSSRPRRVRNIHWDAKVRMVLFLKWCANSLNT